MRSRPTSPRNNWMCLPLVIALAIVAGNFVLTFRPAVAGPEPLFLLDEGRQASLPVEYWVDTRFTPEENAAIRAGFSAWEEFPGSPVSFVFRGTRSTRGQAKADGFNTVVRSERALRASSEGVIAQAVRVLAPETQESASTRRYADTDIVLDFSGGTPWATSGAPGAHDLQSVVTHEVGHVLGLDDVTDSRQVMCRFSSRDEACRRYLAWGDRSGLIKAYRRPHQSSALSR